MEAAELKRISTLTVWSLNIQLLRWQHWLQTSLTTYITPKKTVWPWKNHTWHGPQMCHDWWKLATPPMSPWKSPASENWGSFIGSWLLKSTLQGFTMDFPAAKLFEIVDLLKHASWHFQKNQASEHHPWSMSKLWEDKVMVVILAHDTCSHSLLRENERQNLGLLRSFFGEPYGFADSCFTSTSWFFGRARAVVWFPWRSDWTWIRDVKVCFFVKKWARFALMVSDGSSVPVWKDTNYVISYLAEIQEESSWLLHFSHIPTTSHETATPCLASTSVSPWVLPDLPDPEANGKTSLFWNKKHQMAGLSAYWLYYQLVQLFQTSKTPNR